MRFFDLHSHPAQKTLFNKLTPWELIPMSDKLIGDILESQSTLKQFIMNGTCNLICVTLHPPEVGMLDQFIWKFAPLFTQYLDQDIIEKMISGDFDHQEVLAKELSNLELPPKDPSKAKPLHILKDFKEYKRDDFSKLYILFNIEGGHPFYNANNRTDDIDKMLADLTAFITNPNRLVLYITPTHLTPNIFITHAYGNKILAKGKLMPKGMGITYAGGKFLDVMVNNKVLIDVKHMSLISRQTLYQNANWTKRPLICSHAGLTGCSWQQKLSKEVMLPPIKKGKKFVKVRYTKTQGLLKETEFNPCSVNLYNEDILAILKSGGLIGISMDLRIIGGGTNIFGRMKPTEKEFVSIEEFEEWEKQNLGIASLSDNDFGFPYNDVWINDTVDNDIWDEEDIEEELEELNEFNKSDIENFYLSSPSELRISALATFRREKKLEHLRFFINQIFHVVKVGEENGFDNPWKHICIGSDFDGLIKAIDACKNVSQISSFSEAIIEQLPELAKEAKIKLPKPEKELIEDIFFNNAYNFISNL